MLFWTFLVNSVLIKYILTNVGLNIVRLPYCVHLKKMKKCSVICMQYTTVTQLIPATLYWSSSSVQIWIVFWIQESQSSQESVDKEAVLQEYLNQLFSVWTPRRKINTLQNHGAKIYKRVYKAFIYIETDYMCVNTHCTRNTLPQNRKKGSTKSAL